MKKSYEEINEKIRQGKAVVLTAEEVSQLARTLSPGRDRPTRGRRHERVRSRDVLVGAFLNFGTATAADPHGALRSSTASP